jgi:hypothetical protein
MKGTLTTSLTYPIEVSYELLPAEHGLPEQIDVTDVTITVVGKTGRKRKVSLLNSLGESEIFLLEDEIQEKEEW